METEGFTVEYLRKRVSKHMRKNRTHSSNENILRELEKEVKASVPECLPETSIAVPTMPSMSDFDMVNAIHRWAFKFLGEHDLLDFLESFEEFTECHRIPYDRLLPSLLTRWREMNSSELGKIFAWKPRDSSHPSVT